MRISDWSSDVCSSDLMLRPRPVPFSRGSDFSRQTIENYAFFGNVDFDVTDTITVKGGLRYTNSKRHFVGCTFDNNFDPIQDRKSVLAEKSVSVRVDLGGLRIFKKKKIKNI